MPKAFLVKRRRISNIEKRRRITDIEEYKEEVQKTLTEKQRKPWVSYKEDFFRSTTGNWLVLKCYILAYVSKLFAGVRVFEL